MQFVAHFYMLQVNLSLQHICNMLLVSFQQLSQASWNLPVLHNSNYEQEIQKSYHAMHLVLALTHITLFKAYIHTQDELYSESPLVDTCRSPNPTLRSKSHSLRPSAIGSNFTCRKWKYDSDCSKLSHWTKCFIII